MRVPPDWVLEAIESVGTAAYLYGRSDLKAENAKLRELCADMLRCIHYVDELDLFYYAPSKQGCGMDCVVNGEDCCAKQLHDRARELGIEVDE